MERPIQLELVYFTTRQGLNRNVREMHAASNALTDGANDSQRSERKQNVCDMCDYKSSWNFNLKRHIRVVHEIQKSYNCEGCKKLFSTGPI